MSDIKVLIIDDSAIVRSTLSKQLDKTIGIKVVGTAMDPFVARKKILDLKPDVLTLDIEMPRMDGLTFLEKLMAHYPLPVIVLSSLAPEGSDSYFRALELGALEVISKPDSAFGQSINMQIDQIAQKIKSAAKTNMQARQKIAAIKSVKATSNILHKTSMLETTDKIVALAASTGGTQTFRAIVASLPAMCPPMIVVQHMPPVFTASYAQSLNEDSPMEVREAKDGDTLHSGLILIAPGNYHVTLNRSGARYFVELNQRPHVNYVRPAADVLFYSVADIAGKNAVSVILTGMGSDGAKGMQKMVEAGASAIVQDEESSIVFGMPKAAWKLGLVKKLTALEKIPNAIMNSINGKV